MIEKQIAFFDVETTPTKVMVGFKVNGKYTQLQSDQSKKIKKMLDKYICVGFNSIKYDNTMVSGMVNGLSAKELYTMSVQMIEEDIKYWTFDQYRFENIDIMEVLYGQGGLKMYGARSHSRKLQELPYDPHVKHTKEMWENVMTYNKVDLDVTELLYNQITPQLNLRRTLGRAFMSKSDPQIAEMLFASALGKTNKELNKGKKVPEYVQYKAPANVKFDKKLVKKIETSKIEISNSGSPILPDWFKGYQIVIGKGVYNLGIGGLHSTEKCTSIVPKKGEKLGNVDVRSYYPSMIIALGLYPEHIGHDFLKEYTSVYDERMALKDKAGDRTEEEKAIIEKNKMMMNGSYGKFGSIYSYMYAPQLLIQTTLTGQLYLLHLIEMLENKGIRVVSANTDGVEVVYKDKKKLEKVVSKWEKITNMVMEYGEYKSLHSRDVNAYVAVYDGYTKAKGFYSDETLQKNPVYPIVIDAVKAYLLKGTKVEDTINAETKIERFCISRTVRGGGNYVKLGKHSDEYLNRPDRPNKALDVRDYKYRIDNGKKSYLGKVVRFYYSTKGGVLSYVGSGNKVPMSEGAKPMMDLVDKLPKDLDYKKYYALAIKHIEETGMTYE